MNQIYWTGIEYLYTKSHSQYSKLKGGFVYAFLRTENAMTFLEKVLSFFLNEKLEIIKVEFISIYDKDMKWDKPEDAKIYRSLVEKAELTNEIVVDDFYAYQH